MDVTDIFLQELHPKEPIRKMERKLFDAIKKRHLEKVKSDLNFFHSKCDINCVNNSGKTVLQVAADLEDVSIRNDIIKSLLSGGADLELALLHAVRENNVKCVEILLRFHGIPSLQPDPPGVVGCLGIERQRHITPLILAACLQNFTIVELFLENGFTICDPRTDIQQSVDSNGALNEKL